MFPHEVRYTLGTYSVIDDCNAQDAALHNIFALMIYRDLTKEEILEAAYTLYRLYFVDGWMAARVFFYLLTEKLINDQEPVIVLDGDVPPLDPRTITMVCSTRCKALNRLWFDSDSFYSRDSDGDEDSNHDDDDDDDTGSTEDDNEVEVLAPARAETEVLKPAESPRGAVYDIDPRDISHPRWNP